ncbi:MAG: hypothetical protein RRY09_06645 [Oscillospiraceae bacterium]
MADRGIGRGINIGITSVVVMFVAIALTIFAALTVSTASQEKKLAEKFAVSVTDYWRADAECAELANAFGALHESSADLQAAERLAAAEGAVCRSEGEDRIISFSRDISENAVLRVTLRIGEAFKIEEWRMAAEDSDWSPDTSIPVWQG